MARSLDLDVDSPDKVPDRLAAAADAFAASAEDLASAWQDPGAGRVWHELAKILDRAAVSARKAVRRYWGR